MDVYKRTCLEQIETIRKLIDQNKRLILLLGQYTDIAEEETYLKTLTQTETYD